MRLSSIERWKTATIAAFTWSYWAKADCATHRAANLANAARIDFETAQELDEFRSRDGLMYAWPPSGRHMITTGQELT